MAAARFSRNIIRLSTAIHSPPPPPRILTYRTQSNKATNPIDDLELDSDPIIESDSDHLLALRSIESAMHQILVRKSTPGWLPLVPGGSYWVPPPSSQKPHTVAEMVEKLASSLKKEEDKAAAFVRTERGWPSKAFFFKGASPHSIEMEIVSNNKSQSEDEE